MAAKKTKSSGKSAKPGAKARGAAKPVRKAAVKTAKKPKAAPAKKAAKPAKAPPKKTPARPAAKPAKPVAKAAAPKPAAKVAAAKSVAKSAPAPRHPQRRPEAPAPAAKSVAKPAPPAETATPRPVAIARPTPVAKRPFSRESVRVGESRHAQPTGARPVFPTEFLDRQRERLQIKKQEILAMYQKDLKSGQESNDSPTEDLVDRANNAYTRELAFSISDSERELMHQIDLAIERLKSGSYGFCLHTGQQIGQARLEAIPWAKYSVEAQELLEKGLLSEA